MNITSEIYRKIIEYLNNEIRLPDLENWLLSNLGQILNLPPSPAQDLAGDIELGLAEMSNGHRTESEFKSMMRNLIESGNIVIFDEAAAGPYSISTGTANPAPIFLDSTILSDTPNTSYRQVPV
jgi:hypothetical protein